MLVLNRKPNQQIVLRCDGDETFVIFSRCVGHAAYFGISGTGDIREVEASVGETFIVRVGSESVGVKITQRFKNQVRVGFTASDNVKIDRREVYDKKKREGSIV